MHNIHGEWEKSDWYRAVTLTERKVSLAAEGDARNENSAWNSAQAEQKLQQWKMRAPFQNVAYFAERLAGDGMTENDLLALLAQPIEALKARLSPPDWLVEIRLAFELFSPLTAYPLPIQGLSASKPALAFLKIIHPLLDRAIQRLITGINNLSQTYTLLPFDQQTIVTLLFASLSQKLLSKVSRTFVLEMSVARNMGHLYGGTPEERFHNFIEQFSQPEKSLTLLEEYPVLARQCVVTLDQWVNCSLELLSHLCSDWKHICATFTPEVDPGLLSEIHAGAGDTHQEGRSVTTLKFRSGLQLVYKPRSLAIDLHFQEMLLWLNTCGSHPSFQTSRVIDRGSYGWAEFVTARECSSEEEMQRFYERQGAYLALLHLLNATDLHAENVIAVGEHPMLIDLETLFHSHLETNNPLFSQEPAFEALAHSVMRVGMLPYRMWGDEEGKGINMSGLGGEQGQMLPRSVPQWENAGTDQMRLVRVRTEMATSQNRPILKGKPANALAYRDNLLAGFDGMYQTLLEQRERLLAEILPRFAQDTVRFILRPTDIYARFLYDSFRPELLRDALERELHFDRLWVGIEWQQHMARIIPAERADFLLGDIPLFTTRPGCLDLFTSQGEPVPAFFKQTHMDLVKKHVQQLGDQDRRLQRWIINASFADSEMDNQRDFKRLHPQLAAQTDATRSDWLAAARSIGDDLCQRAILREGSAGWSGLFQIREHAWEVQAAGLDLYNGLPGIALFLAYLAELTAEASYLKLARATLRNVQAQIQHTPKPHILKSVGAFGGGSGLLYLFTQLGVLWNDPTLLQEAQKLVPLLRNAIAHDDAFDMLAGCAGCISALLSLYTVAPDEYILETAIACGDHLLAHASTMQTGIGWKLRQQDYPLTGLAHGNAGIALSLFRLADKSGATRFYQAACAALDYERSLFSPEQQNWPDLRKNKGNTPDGEGFMVAWCHGAPGIALARMASLRFLAEETMHEEIAYALATTCAASEIAGTDPTLCHGAAGLLETLLTASQIVQHEDYTRQIQRLAQQLQTFLAMENMSAEPHDRPWWMENPAFMMGLAGIGYTFLRLVDPLHVPSILTLADPLPK